MIKVVVRLWTPKGSWGPPSPVGAGLHSRTSGLGFSYPPTLSLLLLGGLW